LKEKEILKYGQRKMAAWMVSHCTTDSERELFVEEFQRFIEIDIFGACGKKSCPK